jgi:hypothetical protein
MRAAALESLANARCRGRRRRVGNAACNLNRFSEIRFWYLITTLVIPE